MNAIFWSIQWSHWRYLTTCGLDHPVISDGCLKASDVPGLGVDLTDSTINKYPYLANSGYRLPESKS